MLSVDTAITIAVFFGLFMSMVVHEMAHAVTALWFGDDTAKRLGRITLDPLAHIDPFMTVLVPILTYLGSNGNTAFGGALPVPIDPRRLRNPKHDMLWIAAAGPISNCLIAAILVLSLNLTPLLANWDPRFTERWIEIIQRLILINLFLAAFNMMPVPPLDGSKILAAFLPDRTAEQFLSLEQSGGLLLVAVLVFTGLTQFLGEPVLRGAQFLFQWLYFVQ